MFQIKTKVQNESLHPAIHNTVLRELKRLKKSMSLDSFESRIDILCLEVASPLHLKYTRDGEILIFEEMFFH